MKNFIPLMFFICLPFLALATNDLKPVALKIAESKTSGNRFASASPFILANIPADEISDLNRVVHESTVLGLNNLILESILSTRPENILFSIPQKNGSSLRLELYKADIFTPDFSVVSSGNGPAFLPDGIHYRGIIEGDYNSVAAISIFDHEVMGLISSPAEGNRVLGKLKNDPGNNHIFYNDKDLAVSSELKCLTAEDGISYSSGQLQSPDQTSINCIRIYWELNYDIFLDKGSVINATNYAVGLFNESATLYANDGIPVELSQVYVWNTPSPYTSSTPPGLLGQFQSYRNSFNGDIGHLLGFAGGGGIAAGFNGLCAPNLDNSQCFSGIDATYQNVPVFSWSVEVVTHEQGHLLGSRHTHACVWNGNNTAIDACGPTAGYPYEGNCSGAQVPPGGGTVMSYCHLLPTGINFSNGFGPQPAAVIINNYNNATCLSPCTGGSFCFTSSNTTTLNVTTTTADLVWESVPGAVSYNIQYRITGTIPWSTDTSVDTIYNAGGLTPGSNYEWQVQTVCAGGTSLFTSYAYFITIPLSCDPPTFLWTSNVSAFSAIFNWNSMPGAISYNIQYRIVGAVVWTTASTVDTSFYVTGLTASSAYEWQVQTVCTGGGISGFSAINVFATHEIGAIETIVLQPDGECGKDALVGNNVPTGYSVTNFGDTPEFNALAWTAGGGDSDHRSLLQYDLTFIPEGSMVQSAYLSLYWNPTSSNTGHSTLTGPNDATLSEIAAPWDEHVVTWQNQPATTLQNQVYLPASTSTTQDYLNIDVTDMIQGFVNDPQSNYGMMFRSVSETAYHSLIFCSSDHLDPLKRPRLEITYSPNVLECPHYQYSNCMGTDALIGNCVLAGYDTTNFGNNPEFNALSWTYSGTVTDHRSMISWNLAEIPTTAIIDSAKFSLYWNPTSVNTGHSVMNGPNDSYLLKITSPWAENSVTWNTQPATTTINQVYLPPSTNSTQDFLDMDITPIVQDWVTNPAGNYGLMMKLATEVYYRSLTFCSSDHADPARHPRLDICYHLPTRIEKAGSAAKIYEDFEAQSLHVIYSNGFPQNTALAIYNSQGQLIRSFENLSGNHFVMGKGDLAPGIYFYRLDIDGKSDNGKIIFR